MPEIDPADVKGTKIAGLRGAGALTRWPDGYDTDQISNDNRLSRQMSITTCGLRIGMKHRNAIIHQQPHDQGLKTSGDASPPMAASASTCYAGVDGTERMALYRDRNRTDL